MMKYVESSPKLKWALMENVQQMFHCRKKFGNEKPMEIQNKAMKRFGFHCAFALMLNASEYGLCQSRARAWVLYIRETHLRHWRSVGGVVGEDRTR